MESPHFENEVCVLFAPGQYPRVSSTEFSSSVSDMAMAATLATHGVRREVRSEGLPGRRPPVVCRDVCGWSSVNTGLSCSGPAV